MNVVEIQESPDLTSNVRDVPPSLVARCTGMMSKMREGCRVFDIHWTGDYVPSGARILGYEVLWTQHGLVTAKDLATGKAVEFGTYERISTTNPQWMRVWVHKSVAAKP